MTNRKLTTIIGGILLALAAILQGFDINIGEEQISTITNSIVAIIGAVLTIVGPSVKPPKGGVNLLLISLMPALILGGVSTQFVGCASVEKVIQDNPTVFKWGLRAATYLFVHNNPSILVKLTPLSNVLKDPKGAVSPEALKQRLYDEVANSGGLVEGEKILLREFIDDYIIEKYQKIYDANIGKVDTGVLEQILEAAGEAIAFVQLFPPDSDSTVASDGTVADAKPFTLQTPGGLVLIE